MGRRGESVSIRHEGSQLHMFEVATRDAPGDRRIESLFDPMVVIVINIDQRI
jgi:hypothetical protein